VKTVIDGPENVGWSSRNWSGDTEIMPQGTQLGRDIINRNSDHGLGAPWEREIRVIGGLDFLDDEVFPVTERIQSRERHVQDAEEVLVGPNIFLECPLQVADRRCHEYLEFTV
jgi:hypothetical protein